MSVRWGFHLVQCNYRTGGSTAAVQHHLQHHEPWRIHTLKEYWCENRFFLLLNTATASLLTLILAQAFQLGRGFHYTLPSDYKQHDVPAVLDTIVNLFPHNIAIVLQLFQETSPRSLPDWELTSACPDAQAYGRCCWRCSLSMRKG